MIILLVVWDTNTVFQICVLEFFVKTLQVILKFPIILPQVHLVLVPVPQHPKWFTVYSSRSFCIYLYTCPHRNTVFVCFGKQLFTVYQLVLCLNTGSWATFFFFFWFFFCIFRAAPMAHGSSQARDWIRSCSCSSTQHTQQHGIRAASLIYTTAHGNASRLAPTILNWLFPILLLFVLKSVVFVSWQDSGLSQVWSQGEILLAIKDLFQSWAFLLLAGPILEYRDIVIPPLKFC